MPLLPVHKVGFDPMTGDMMSTQQDNANVASGHSFADQVGSGVATRLGLESVLYYGLDFVNKGNNMGQQWWDGGWS